MRLGNLGMMMAVCAASPASGTGAPPIGSFGDVQPDRAPKHKGKGRNMRRGTGKSNPPKSRPNRLTISKRVRRKHRKAAR